MFRSFIKTTLRYFSIRKNYTAINISCLTFGLTCCIIAMFYITDIFSYDRFQKNYHRLYSVEAYVTYFNGDRFPKPVLSASLPELISENAPEIAAMVRVAEYDHSFINGEKKLNVHGIYADNNFFDVFTFPFINDTKTSLLKDPKSIYISNITALKFFGTADCEGKTLILNEVERQEAFTVAGVFRDVPRQSSFSFDFVIPFSSFLAHHPESLDQGASVNRIWALLDENVQPRMVENKIKGLISEQESTKNQELFLFPLKEQVLYSYAAGRRVWKEMQKVVIAGSIGLFILLIACFNYVNLSVAMNFRRYRETGVRKVFGSDRGTIIVQFLLEAFIVSFISLIIAIILSLSLLAALNSAFHYDLHPGLLNFKMLLFLACITILTAITSGFMPAFYMSSVDPVESLKGKVLKTHSFSVFRRSLFIFQFMIPFALVICVTIIISQDKYMSEYDAGIDREKVMVLENTGAIAKHPADFKSGLMTIPGIDAVSFTSCIPTRGAKVTNEISWDGMDTEKKLHFWCVNADYDYNKTVRVQITKGRFFDPSYLTDSSSYLINDVAAGVIGNNDPVGSFITVNGKKGMIIGVFSGFHALDLAGPIVPVIMKLSPNPEQYLLVKFSAGSFGTIRDEILKTHKSYGNDVPVRMTLFRDLPSYSNLGLASGLGGAALIIALLLACAGFFGLASFSAGNRTKEIGIRKAGGATASSVMKLLLKGYTKWLCMAYLIALPVAYIFSRFFLGRFYFHTSISLWHLVTGPLLIFAIALITVASRTWSAANQNPVRALRYE